MVTYKFIGLYITKSSGCGGCGTKKHTLELKTIELKTMSANINLLGEVWSFDPNGLYEFTDEEAVVIEQYILSKKYEFIKQ